MKTDPIKLITTVSTHFVPRKNEFGITMDYAWEMGYNGIAMGVQDHTATEMQKTISKADIT